MSQSEDARGQLQLHITKTSVQINEDTKEHNAY